MPKKPLDLFDRDAEWADLTAFVEDPALRPLLGVVSGRRRQGKTYLLGALADAYGGFHFEATEATEAESLRLFGISLGRFLGAPGPIQFASWYEAVEAVLDLAVSTPTPVILDELPYLAATSPGLPSVIQTGIDRRRRIQGRPVRLLLCGSAMRFMGRLLAGGAPLRGRAGLELVVPTLDYRLAAEFSGIGDPRLAILVHSVLGGTPAYAREYVRDDLPQSIRDFDDWVQRAVLSPASPLFREARYLLAEAPDIRDTATYQSVLAAVAAGNTSRARIASYVGRAATEITHPLNVLEDAGLLIKRQDMLRRARPVYEIGEPLITFYQAIMRPAWQDLERRRAVDVWRRSRSRFLSNVVGPHFEHLCRTWAAGFAPGGTFADAPGDVGHGVVSDPSGRTTHEIDVVVLAQSSGAGRRVLSLGEAKWGQVLGLGRLERLRHVAALLDRRGYDTREVRLACYSGVGFDPELKAAAGRGEALLVTPDSLYA